MCNPASVALTAAGGAASYAGKRRADKAMTAARAAERARQQGFQQESDAVWQGMLPEMGAAAAQGDMAASQARRAASEQALAAPGIVLPAMGGNQIIDNVAAQESAQQAARTAAVGTARRDLDSFGDSMLEQGLARQGAAQRIGTINGLRRGSAAVLPYELQAGANRGAGLQMVGSLLTNLGVGAAFGAGASGAAPWWDQLRTIGAPAGSGLTPAAGSGALLGAGGSAAPPALRLGAIGTGLRL